MNDKCNSAKKSAYVQTRGAAQRRLRQMKKTWWSATAELLQLAADRHDMKAFYNNHLQPFCAVTATNLGYKL